VDHSTLNRWVLKFAPELDKRIRPFLNPTNDGCDLYLILLEGNGKAVLIQFVPELIPTR